MLKSGEQSRAMGGSEAKMWLKVLLVINAVFNLIGAVILLFAPAAVMRTAGVPVDPGADFVCHLLGATSLSLAILSFGARALRETAGRVVAVTFIVFHGATAAVGIHTFAGGLGARVWCNVAVHLVFGGLFALLGFQRGGRPVQE